MAMPAPGPTGELKQAEEATTGDLGCRVAGANAEAQRRAPFRRLLRRPRVWLLAALLLGLVAAGLALAGPSLRAWYHFRAARSALQSYHNSQAIRHLQACQRVWSQDPDVLLLTARRSEERRVGKECRSRGTA